MELLHQLRPNPFLQAQSRSLGVDPPSNCHFNPVKWTLNTLGVIASESIKSVQRAGVRDILDTANASICLGMLGTCVASEVSQVLDAKSLINAGSLALIGLSKTSLVGVQLSLLWCAGFYALHHIPRKIDKLINSETKPTQSLSVSMEKVDLTDKHLNAIRQIALQLKQQFSELPDTLATELITEIALGNWQLNHAFELFNPETTAAFSKTLELIHSTMPPVLAFKLETALQQVQIPEIKTLLRDTPLTTQTAIKELLDTRTCRNLTCFTARAIRGQRQGPTAFERQYIQAWLDEHEMLHDTRLNMTPQRLIELMVFTMNALADKELSPLLNIQATIYEAMPPSSAANQLEQQMMRRLNTTHDHRLHNIENIPKHGPGIIALNHSLFTFDICMAIQHIRDQVGRHLNMVIDEALMSLPFVSPTMLGLGYRLGEKNTFIQMLGNNNLMAVAPGGAKEGMKPYEKANILYWNKAKGFVRTHLMSGAPLICLISPQVDQLRKNKIHPLYHWLQATVFTPLKVPMIPPLLAPMARDKVRVDHFTSQPYEAPPFPMNNMKNSHPLLRRHVDNIHQIVVDQSQQMLHAINAQVTGETEDQSYPLATPQ